MGSFFEPFFFIFFQKIFKKFSKIFEKKRKKIKKQIIQKVTPKTSQNVIKNVQKMEVLERFSDTPAACVLHGFSSVLMVFGRFCSFWWNFCLPAQEPAVSAGFKCFLGVFSSVVCVVLSFFPLVFRSLRVFFFCCALFCSARAIFFCFTSTLFVFCFSKFRLRFREFLIFFPKFFQFLLKIFSVSAPINSWKNDSP